MKNSFLAAAALISGLFLLFAGVFAPAAKIVRADDGRDGASAEIEVRPGAGSTTRVRAEAETKESENENELKDDDAAELELEQGDNDVRSTSSLELSIKHRQAELEKEASSTEDNDAKEVLKDQNQMRLAVHALLSSKDLLGGIGPQVAALAKDLNSSVSSTVTAETEIQARGWFRKFFFGGDKEHAESIQSQVNKNREDIKKLQQLIAGCQNCSADLKTMLADRLNIATAEQTRLEAVAKAELDAQGIFGALFGWLKK